MRRVTAVATLVMPLLAAAEASGAAPAGAAVRKCDRKVVLRYDITVTGSQTGRETFPADSAFAGEDSVSYDYSAITIRFARRR
jgi:hypothetical protein